MGPGNRGAGHSQGEGRLSYYRCLTMAVGFGAVKLMFDIKFSFSALKFP